MSNPFSEKLDCLSQSGHDTTISLIKNQIEKTVSAESEETYGFTASKSKIRAALDQVKFFLEDIRTSKEDPNSSKKFCTGKLKIVFPDTVITDSEKTRELKGWNNITSLSDNSSIERQANAFLIDIDFNIQPTDDGQKVYAEMEDGETAPNFVSAIVGGHLARKSVQQTYQEEQQQTQLDQQQQEAALTEQKQAALGEAKAINELSMQTINAIWSAIPTYQRDQLLPLQRAWIKKKSADCRVESAGVSTDISERETARLQCEAKMNNERSGQLRRFTYEDENSESYN